MTSKGHRIQNTRPIYSSGFFNSSFALLPREEAWAVSAFFAASAVLGFGLCLPGRTRSSRPSSTIFASHDFISFSYRTLSSSASCRYGWKKSRRQQLRKGLCQGHCTVTSPLWYKGDSVHTPGAHFCHWQIKKKHQTCTKIGNLSTAVRLSQQTARHAWRTFAQHCS